MVTTTAGQALIALGDGAGGLAAPTTVLTGGGPIDVTVLDVSGDGQLDLLTANFLDGTVSVLLGDGKGAFVATTAPAVGKRSNAPGDRRLK